MGRMKLPLTAAILSGLLSLGCYTTAPLRMKVQSQVDDQSCVRTTDRVFADAGFERVRTLIGPDMFYTPRTTPSAQIALGWGIGAWVSRDHSSESCGVTIEALSDDPTPGGQRSFTSQRGDSFDAAVRDMAQRLQVAFAAAR